MKDLEWSTPLQLRSELAKLFTNRHQGEGDQKIAVNRARAWSMQCRLQAVTNRGTKKAGIVKHHYKATLRARKEVYKMLASGGGDQNIWNYQTPLLLG